MAAPSQLREYFYVDIDRVDSLLAQMGGDLPPGEPTSRRYGDALFTRFEAGAEAMGLIDDVTERATEPMVWADGSLHESMAAGSLIRVTAPVQVMDSDSVSDALRRLFQLFQATQAAERPQSTRAARRAGAPEPDNAFSFVTDLYGSLLPGGVWVRSMPTTDGEHVFIGSLGPDNAYLAPERASLLARYGSGSVPWTMVASVTRVATERGTTEFPDIDPFDEYGNFSPAAIEELHMQLLDMVEGFGLVGAPVWPSVAVTPLAMYRPVGGYKETKDEDGEDGEVIGTGGSPEEPSAKKAKPKSGGAKKASMPEGTVLKF